MQFILAFGFPAINVEINKIITMYFLRQQCLSTHVAKEGKFIIYIFYFNFSGLKSFAPTPKKL